MKPSDILLIVGVILGILLIMLFYGILKGLLIIGIGIVFIYSLPKLCDFIDKKFG